jgi:hypothetical protein
MNDGTSNLFGDLLLPSPHSKKKYIKITYLLREGGKKDRRKRRRKKIKGPHRSTEGALA